MKGVRWRAVGAILLGAAAAGALLAGLPGPTGGPGGGSGAGPDLPVFGGAGGDDPPSPAGRGPAPTGPLLRGAVVDGGGAPVPGAEVAASADGNPRPVRAATGPDGRFALAGFGAGEDLLVGARAPGFAPTMAGGARAGGEEVLLVLSPPARLAGRVLSPDGEPRPGARVRIHLRFPGVSRALGGMEVRADEEGGFRFDGLPAVPGTAEAAWKGAGSGPAEFDLSPGGGEVRLDLVVDEGPALSGRAVDDRGNPVPGLHVSARGPDGHATLGRTGEDGSFRVPGLGPGPHAVRVRDMLARFEDPPPLEGILAPRTGLEFTLRRRADAPGRLAFRCADAEGRPLGTIETEGRRLDGRDTSRTSWAAGADGVFLSGNLSPGRYRYVFRSPGGTATEEFTVAAGETADLGLLRLSPAAAIRFRVVDPEGRPLAGILALVGGTDHPERPRDGAPGTFLVEGLPPGAGTVRLLHRSREGREVPWAAGPGETADLGEIVLAPATGRIRGCVVDAAGGPAAGATVKLVLRGAAPSDGTEVVLTAGPDGTFLLEGAAGGTWGTAVLLPPLPGECDARGDRVLFSWRAGPDLHLDPGAEASLRCLAQM